MRLELDAADDDFLVDYKHRLNEKEVRQVKLSRLFINRVFFQHEHKLRSVLVLMAEIAAVVRLYSVFDVTSF